MTTFDWIIRDYRIRFKNKHLTPALDCQSDPAGCGKGIGFSINTSFNAKSILFSFLGGYLI